MYAGILSPFLLVVVVVLFVSFFTLTLVPRRESGDV